MKQYNFNKNFTDFRKNLNLAEQDKLSLTDARKIIRSTIRVTFNEMPEKYFTDNVQIVLTEFSKGSDKRIKPKFRTQGSFVYNTINKPENPPIQRMDLDDGVYLPLSYTDNTSDNFQQSAKIVKNIISNCVSDLCNDKGWTLETNHSKCLRIIINPTSHIDLPIYSIPDDQSNTIQQDSAEFSRMEGLERVLSYNKAEDVLLAIDNGWIKSDPRDIEDWVKDTKDRFNDFIYYSRYFKAWKDHQWNESKFSSIMIMAGISQAMSEIGYSKNDNVALNLSSIATSLKLYLNNAGINHPVKTERMDGDLSNKDEIINRLDDLAMNLFTATKTNNTQLLIDCFGDRFPNDTGNVLNTGVVAPAIITSSEPIRQSRSDFI
ncbi:hypothetical protein SPONN_1310 [uncultured Candidatus Thioglobus sp.]|nr:hypothetical protein SPONN_1310 [uncultured Candidatus Thioglobus sp.]